MECLFYIDDVVTLGKDENECLERTQHVLERIYTDNWICSSSKSEFLLGIVEVLGHII